MGEVCLFQRETPRFFVPITFRALVGTAFRLDLDEALRRRGGVASSRC